MFQFRNLLKGLRNADASTACPFGRSGACTTCRPGFRPSWVCRGAGGSAVIEPARSTALRQHRRAGGASFTGTGSTSGGVQQRPGHCRSVVDGRPAGRIKHRTEHRYDAHPARIDRRVVRRPPVARRVGWRPLAYDGSVPKRRSRNGTKAPREDVVPGLDTPIPSFGGARQPLLFEPSSPGLSRGSTSGSCLCSGKTALRPDMDGRDKPGHDGEKKEAAEHETQLPYTDGGPVRSARSGGSRDDRLELTMPPLLRRPFGPDMVTAMTCLVPLQNWWWPV
jgi:hypothetical protein